MSVWITPMTDPTTMVRIATTHSATTSFAWRSGGSAEPTR